MRFTPRRDVIQTVGVGLILILTVTHDIAGFYPTTVSYLSLFYTRFEFGRRLGLFYGSYGVAGALGGVIAYLVFSRFPSDDISTTGHLESDNSWQACQVLFLVEGCLTIVVAMAGFFWLPKSAGTAWFLNPEERECAETRVALDREMSYAHAADAEYTALVVDATTDGADRFSEDEGEQSRRLLGNERAFSESSLTVKNGNSLTADAGLSRSEILSTILFLPMIFPILVLNIASAIPSTGFSIFLPIVLSSMKMSSPLHSNILTVPPFLLASITLYIFMHWSDKSRKRFLPILASLVVIMVGLALILLLSPPSSSIGTVVLYLCMCLLLSGCFIPSPLTVAWFAGNIPDPGKRAIVLGINGYGNLAGIFAARIFAPKYQKEGFRTSFWMTLVITSFSLVGFAGLRVVLGMINDARKRFLLRWTEADLAEEHASGTGKRKSWHAGIPNLVIVGGRVWDESVRRLVGVKLLGMDADSASARRGDEKMTFTYGY